MAEPPNPPRAALYVDFDNVFLSLARWDERAAYAFGERPDAWLAWLEGRNGERRPMERRTLVRRCYLNPGGYFDFHPGRAVARYRAARDLRNRTYFSEFRAAFVAAGFDVVDCPPVAYLKNTADMKMALDIREALDHPTRFDEFVLLSGDSDFLPALARLRAHDRRITILAQGTAKRAYLAAADLVVGLEEFADRGMGEVPVIQAQVSPAPPPLRVEQPRPEPPAEPDGLRSAVLAWLRDGLAGTPSGAVRMTDVGQHIHRRFPELRTTNYAGAGSLTALIEEAGDPRLSLSGPADRRWLYDAERGPPPGDLPPGVEEQPGIGTPPLETDAPIPVAQPEVTSEPPAPPPLEAALPEAMPQPLETAEPEAAPEPPGEELMAEAALLVRDLLWGSRDVKGHAQDLPALPPSEIGFVLAAIAARQPFDTLDAEAIAAEAAALKLFVSPREVMAILRWLHRGFAKLSEPPPPDAALRLGRILYATLLAAVRGVEEQLSETEKEALRRWTASAAPT